MKPTLAEILADTTALLRREAGRTGMVALSPEVVELLEKLEEPAHSLPASEPQPYATSPTLEALAAEVAACERCGLCRTRTQTVFGAGNPNADLVFVGEAPGAEEDAQGLPFVGASGQLLTGIIEKGMGIPRGSVYICNVLKCRPPGNRDPSPEEKRLCEPFLLRQLDLIQPKVICVLGKQAAQTLLRTDQSLGALRGRWHDYNGIPLRVTYHPAYLLRSPGEKAKAWEDIKEVMKMLGIEVPQRKG